MTFYLSWKLIPYTVWVLFWTAMMIFAFRYMFNNKLQNRKLLSVLIALVFIFMVQFPVRYTPEVAEKYRSSFDVRVTEAPNVEIIHDKERKSYQESIDSRMNN